MVFDLKNKVVLITGAATGIGACAVRIFLDEGVKILQDAEKPHYPLIIINASHVAILDVAEEAGIKLQNELNAKHGSNKVKFYKCDVTNDDALFAAFKSTIDENDYIDVVINNAAILNDDMHSYKKQIEINVTALVTSSLKALELMRKDQGGRGGIVVNTSSIAALCQTPMTPIYSGTKSAVLQFGNCLGMEDYYSKTGVKLVTICYGATHTALLSAEKMGHFDKEIEAEMAVGLSQFKWQKAESAAHGLVDVCKLGETGSTWIATNDRPVKDITDTVRKAYALMAEHVYANDDDE